MAARLPVLMIQSPAPSPDSARLSDSIVGELIGKPGLDLMMVESAGITDGDSTDRLTLEALPNDVAVLDWATPEQIEQKLRQVDSHWTRSRHTGDPEVPPAQPNQKRLYAFDLHRISSVRELERQLRQLFDSKQVQTIPLFVPGQRAPAGDSNSQPSTNNLPSKASAAPSNTNETDGWADESVHSKSDDSPNSALDLDDLMDELDRMDP